MFSQLSGLTLHTFFCPRVRNRKRWKLAHPVLWVAERGGEANGTVQRTSEGTEKEGVCDLPSYLHAGEI